MTTLRRAVRALTSPWRAVRFLVRGEALIAASRDEARETRAILDALAVRVAEVQKAVTRTHAKQLGDLARSVNDLRKELREGVMQLSLRAAVEPGQATPAAATGGKAIPLAVDPVPLPWSPVGDGAVHPDPDGREWLLLAACPVCGHGESTAVLEWNKLLMLERAPDDTSARYDYVLCHACGVLYASRRPVGHRHLFLLEHFAEVIAKRGGSPDIPNPILNPYPLSDADRERLRAMAARGVFVSEHLGLRKREYLEGLVKDRFESSVHVDILANLAASDGGRILELRPRTGAIGESLRRLFRADVSVIPMWESQRFLLKEVYGFDSPGLVDYDHFRIPYTGPFNLIVCNHMLTHMLRPAEFLKEIRTHLTPGGYVYFYNEPEDTEYLEGGQSIIAHFNPLHVQGFNGAALARALAANGFEVVFVKGYRQNHLCLARAQTVSWSPMSVDERDRRVAAFARARDRAILKLPERVRGRVAREWPDAVRRALAAGDVAFDSKQRLRFVASRP